MVRKMKDSGVEWIDEIPEVWDIVRLRYLCNIKTGNKDTINRVDDGEYPFYVRSPNIERINSFSFDGEAILTAGDGVGAGKVFHYVNGKFDYHQRVYNLHDFKNVLAEFLYHFMKINFIKEIEKGTAKSTVDSIRLHMLQNFPICIPSLEEQKKIVCYLNKKVSQIDSLIDNTKQSIEELKKYKQALITETVTKGLNHDVQMKDSGIEWVGDIPKHWRTEKIKRLFYEVNVRNIDDENALLLSLFTAIGVKPRNQMADKGNKSSTVINYKIVQKNDVVVNKLLAWMGSIGYSEYNGVTSPDYDVYRALPAANVVKGYYNNYFRHTNFKDDCYKYGRGIMMMRWRTYPEQFKQILVVNPPYEEQKKIVTYLDEKSSHIDSLIEQKQQLIIEFEEYKKSLIFEYVTGKKEVL